jgi:hypothetical protein
MLGLSSGRFGLASGTTAAAVVIAVLGTYAYGRHRRRRAEASIPEG